MQRPFITSTICPTALLATVDSASAEQYVRQINGKAVIVHTNPLPVVVHRILPPYLGRHITQRRVSNVLAAKKAV